MKLDNSYQMFEYGCHEGNCGLPNILSAARAAEKAEAADRTRTDTNVHGRHAADRVVGACSVQVCAFARSL